MAENQLDNPIWTALTTRHVEISEGTEIGKRYLPSFTTLAGFAEQSDAAYHALHSVMQPKQRIGVFWLDKLVVPSIFDLAAQDRVTQMVCAGLKECKTFPMEVLTTDDVPEMKALVLLTQPGPFAERTIEFGTFLGIKIDGKIAAMAGRRMKLPGFDEVSAVCTHPDHQGKGFARALVNAVSQQIIDEGSTPMLHVRSTNEAAIRSYQSVGFQIRQEFNLGVLKPSALVKS
ncbi:MAG TPA: GNAT family N-acetyltransferase [Drouetiella sp.]